MEAADAIQALLDCDPEVVAPVDDWVMKTFLLPEEESESLLPRRKRRLANGDESIAAALTALPVPPLATPTPAAAPPTCNSTVTESPPEEDVAPPPWWKQLLAQAIGMVLNVAQAYFLQHLPAKQRDRADERAMPRAPLF